MLIRPGSAVWQALQRVYLGQLMLEGSRYLLVAAMVWLVLHVRLRRRLAHRVIAGWPTARDIPREFAYPPELMVSA